MELTDLKFLFRKQRGALLKALFAAESMIFQHIYAGIIRGHFPLLPTVLLTFCDMPMQNDVAAL